MLGIDAGFRLVSNIDSSVLPPSFLVAYHAKSFGDGLERLIRFKSLCTPEEIKTEVVGNYIKLTLCWTYSQEKPPHSLADATFLSIIQLGMQGGGKSSLKVKLMLSRPVHQFSFSCLQEGIQWNAPENILFIHETELKTAFTQFNNELTELLDKALKDELEKQRSELSYSAKVSWMLRRMLTAGRPNLKNVAKELAISERSLQRQLLLEGASFQKILSDTRHQLALDYLKDPELELIEISYLLGYEDQASFHRAFQSWEQQPPTKWRKMHSVFF